MKKIILQFSSNELDCRKFTSIIKLLIELSKNLSINKLTTKRDFYYHDIELFKKNQRMCDEIINLISNSLNLQCERDFLIYPSQKGLIYGGNNIIFEINYKGDSPNDEKIIHQLNYQDNSILIPQFKFFEKSINIVFNKLPDLIIIIEKDAIFKSFCNYLKLKNLINLNILVITGKGFPDHLTKKFVNLISNNIPSSIPILGFMDSDVYGINIFKSYIFNDVDNFIPIPNNNLTLAGVFILDYKKNWLNLSNRDFNYTIGLLKTIQKILNHLQFSQEKEYNHIHHHQIKELMKWHRELTRGLLLFKKAEMNVVDQDCNHYIFNNAAKYLSPSNSQKMT